MSNFSLTLGPVAFAGFEVPSSITLGGKQRLAIHKLPGGIRIIDAMGPDPADLAWSGIFTGPDAADRARILDTLRVAGLQLLLTWDAFLYTVIIGSFEADYRSLWWIPYPPSALLSSVASAVDTVRPVGTQFFVLPPTVLTAAIGLTITVSDNNKPAAQAAVTAALQTYVAALPIGAPLPVSRIAAIAFAAATNITNVASITINGGGDLVPSSTGVVVPGAITVA